MRRTRISVSIVVLGLAVLLAAPLPAVAALLQAQSATPAASGSKEGAVLLFAAPGMQSDVAASFAADGALPALSDMLAHGASGQDGLLPPFPATASTDLATLLTGAWPAEHGIMADRFYRTGSPDFADSAAWTDPGLIQADTLPQAAERAGKQVIAVGWEGVAGLDPTLGGPVVGAPVPFSQAGVVTNVDLPDQPARADRFGLSYDRVDLHPADGWSGAPESYSPAQETAFTIRSLDAAGPNPDRALAVYISDSTDDATTNYDHVLIAPDKDAAQAIAEVGAGAWASATVSLAGDRAGQTAGFWLKAIDLAPDLSQFRLYYTPISRFAATWNACGDRPACASPGGFEEALNRAIGAPVSLDPAPLAAGLIDPATFVDQGTTGSWQPVDALRFIVNDLGVHPDLLLLGTSAPATVSREFLGFLAGDGGSATPVAGDTAAVAPDEAQAFLREGYAMADRLLAAGRELLGPAATTLVAAPGVLVPSWRAVDAGRVLRDAGLAENAQPDNCVPGAVSAPLGTPDPEALPVGPAVKACWSGGTAAISINLNGREAAGSVAEDAFDAIQDAIVAAFEGLRDPAQPDASVVAEVFRKNDLRDVAGADALHPSRAGDVVVVLAPPYRFDLIADAAIAPAPMQAVGGYLVPPAEAHGLFLAAGPPIAVGASVAARAIDVAPTAAFLLDVPGPYNASGSILLDALANGASLTEITLLDISDFHGQLPPLSAIADENDAEGAVNSSYSVGGVAFLDSWFDHYRVEAHGPTLLLTAGDAVGATPPISSAFGDVPTIEIMNALGFDLDSLGNHNFDAGAAYMFGTLEPKADYPYLSANLVPARADAATPPPDQAPFQPSLLLDLDGVSVGIVGFSNPDIPNLTRPGALGPYRVIDPVPAINTEAARLRDEGAQVVFAMGHMGATSGTVTDPTGPVVDVTDQVQGVDLVVADHTDMQVSTTRPNGVLLVENVSKGVMFTRVRLVVDRDSGELVYLTADHHRPWNIGVMPDPEIEQTLDGLQAELAPRLGRVVGTATKTIPRADNCGTENGRTCESLIGDIVTDAMRITYGTDFALTNSGGIRADLTCPPDGGDFCPADTSEHPVTEGQVLAVLPFGNIAVTLTVTGAELKAMLETGVAPMPAVSGGFPQVSGLCFTYDIDAEPGNRVTGAVRQAADGSCTGDAIDFTDAATYTLTTNDFTAAGGDGYPDFSGRTDSRDILASVVTGYVAGASPLSVPGEVLDPTIEGRITCTGADCPVPVGS